MDTKLKSYRNPWLKVLAFIVIIACTVIFVGTFQTMMYKNYDLECVFTENYYDSMEYRDHEAYNVLYDIDNAYDGGTMGNLYLNDYYYYLYDNEQQVFTNVPLDITYELYDSQTKQSTGVSFVGYASPKRYFEQFNKSFYGYKNWGDLVSGKDGNLNGRTIDVVNPDTVKELYIAQSYEVMKENQANWTKMREAVYPSVILMSVMFIIIVVLVAYLVLMAGRRPDGEDIRFHVFDKWYAEIQVFCVFLSSFIGTYMIGSMSYNYYYDWYGMSADASLNGSQWMSIIGVGIVIAINVLVWGAVILSWSRKVKAKCFLRYCLFYSIYKSVGKVFDGSMFEKYPLTKSLHYRQIIFIGTITVLIFFFGIFCLAGAIPLALIMAGIGLVVYNWYIRGNLKTYEEINKGFNYSIEEQMKSERMKVALITNVSHDLKTPLTSIISYVDLLSKEEDLTDTARDYVNILGDKSLRLKNIVSDLFELAKSNSGNIVLDLEQLDMKKLIEQTIADMSDKISNSDLEIKPRLSAEPIYIMADGKKMYRVFQNIIDNALKYSLAGTRVYIDLEDVDGKGKLSIKSTSGYEMNFTVEEVLQRFTRGDESRTGEGSGLGLSIAESFTRACGGEFKVDIDGDLFKVTITFDKI